MNAVNLLAVVFLSSLTFRFGRGYDYVTKTISVPVDHFSFTSTKTFELRYLINDTHWDKNRGPIFFYTGNEGPIELFAENTGFMWEIAEKFKALVVFAEHRYYGQSRPFGNESSDPKNLGYLSSQQALADFVDLISHLNWNENKTYRNPVIAFGGSYGGMLAAYIRMKYPHAVAGAIASSAPIWQFTGMTPCDAYARITTSDFTAENKSCSTFVRNSWQYIRNITSNDEGLEWVTKEWKLCRPLKNTTDVTTLRYWLASMYGSLAMLNYPYPTSFMNALPGHPVREFCNKISNYSATGKEVLIELIKGVDMYNNYTGKEKCLDYDSSYPAALGEDLWFYQACTEMVMPMCTKGEADMFEPDPWNLKEFADMCEKKWNVRPQPYLAEKIYGGKDISAASNIVFSNGLLDPWTGGGVLKVKSPSLKVVLLPEAAHHLELRASNPADPESVRSCRLLYEDLIKTWMREHEAKYLKPTPPTDDQPANEADNILDPSASSSQ